eukprot:TRINITY_DN4346_c1_g1_i2.p1 TRINITY_DN4346_c1_g1~~TRINITY_DN4346_c1_g1_i2.p1  ORF type:complete len:123 (+),score=8.78 TRINITY_DN4346_c1_g1_i2:25-369(+)
MDEQTVKLLRLQTRRIGLAHHLARLARSIRYTEDAGVSKPAKPAPCSSVNAVQDEASEHHEVATYSWATCKHFILLAETEQQHTGDPSPDTGTSRTPSRAQMFADKVAAVMPHR